MYRRLMDYLTKHSILNNHQYGFRKKHSTFMAILELTNKIFDSFEKNEFTIGIFIDLKKAFDTVNHSILLDKLNFYGIRGTPFNWMHRYLLFYLFSFLTLIVINISPGKKTTYIFILIN